MNNTFRLQGKNLFLTYPRCNLTPQEVYRQLLLKNLNIKEYLIIRDLHEDGGFHIHLYLELNKVKDIKGKTILDIEEEGKVIHGNYQTCKNANSTIKYLTSKKEKIKEFIYVTSNEKFFEKGYTVETEKLKKFDPWREYIKLSELGEIEKAMEIIKKYQTKDYAQKYEKLKTESYNFYLRANPFKEKYTMSDFYLSKKLRESIQTLKNLQEEGNLKTIMIIGPSGIGKTFLAKALMKEIFKVDYLYINNIDSLSKLLTNHGGIILDDPQGFENLNRENLISLITTETESTLAVRYVNVKFKPKLIKIIITNKDLLLQYQEVAINRRLEPIIKIEHSDIKFEETDNNKLFILLISVKGDK